jgi:hypothetical protein
MNQIVKVAILAILVRVRERQRKVNSATLSRLLVFDKPAQEPGFALTSKELAVPHHTICRTQTGWLITTRFCIFWQTILIREGIKIFVYAL